MTGDQFDNWLKFHATIVPSFATWMHNVAQRELFHAWRESSTKIDHEKAKAVSKLIASGEIEKPFPEDTLGLVRRVAAEMQDEAEPDPDWKMTAVTCLHCEDYGIVNCWSPTSMAAALQLRDGELDERNYLAKLYKIGVPCSCDAGEKFAKIYIGRGKARKTSDKTRVRYDPETMVRCVEIGNGPCYDANLRDWASTYYPKEHFSQFSD